MKKTGLFLVLFGAIALSGCVKEWQCTCDVYMAGEFVESASTTIEDKKSNAVDECDEGDMTGEVLGIEVESRCEIE